VHGEIMRGEKGRRRGQRGNAPDGTRGSEVHQY